MRCVRGVGASPPSVFAIALNNKAKTICRCCCQPPPRDHNRTATQTSDINKSETPNRRVFYYTTPSAFPRACKAGSSEQCAPLFVGNATCRREVMNPNQQQAAKRHRPTHNSLVRPHIGQYFPVQQYLLPEPAGHTPAANGRAHIFIEIVSTRTEIERFSLLHFYCMRISLGTRTLALSLAPFHWTTEMIPQVCLADRGKIRSKWMDGEGKSITRSIHRACFLGWLCRYWLVLVELTEHTQSYALDSNRISLACAGACFA